MPPIENILAKNLELLKAKFDALNNRAGTVLVVADLLREYINISAVLISELNTACKKINELESRLLESTPPEAR